MLRDPPLPPPKLRAVGREVMTFFNDRDGSEDAKRRTNKEDRTMIGILRYAVYGLAAIGALILLITAISYLGYWIGEIIPW